MHKGFSIVAALLFAALPAICLAGEHQNNVAVTAAIANPDRSAADRERDSRSKPEVILPLLNLSAGDSVADVFGGGGYYTDLMAAIVGPEGEVILHNNTPYAAFVEKQLAERYGDGRRPPVRLLKSEVDDLQLAPESLDAVLMVMSYHDLYYTNPERGWGNTDVGLFFAQILAALKPGGRLVIVDHAAAAGSGSSAAQDLHRIDPVYAREDIEGAGFQFLSASDALRNPDDDHSKMVFDKSIRGQTDRFILAFRKP